MVQDFYQRVQLIVFKNISLILFVVLLIQAIIVVLEIVVLEMGVLIVK